MHGLKGGPLGKAGDHIGDTEIHQNDDPSPGHRESPMCSIAQPAAYLTLQLEW
jgi:hypothetical protein